MEPMGKKAQGAGAVVAGFPSPAEQYLEPPLDLNELLVKRPAATYFVRVEGDSMIGAGIRDKDLLVVAAPLRPRTATSSSRRWTASSRLRPTAGGIATRRARLIRFVRRPAPLGLVLLHFDFLFVRGDKSNRHDIPLPNGGGTPSKARHGLLAERS